VPLTDTPRTSITHSNVLQSYSIRKELLLLNFRITTLFILNLHFYFASIKMSFYEVMAVYNPSAYSFVDMLIRSFNLVIAFNTITSKISVCN